jgi:hypothetical protein
MPNIQHLDIYRGTNQTVTIAGRDQSNAIATLTSKTVSVYVANRPNDPDVASAVLTKSGTVVSTTAGTFSVAITPDDTASLEGDYRYQAKTTDGSGNVAVVAVGRFRIRPDITS